jgi:integrase
MAAVPIKLTVEGLKKAACRPGKREDKLPIEGHRGAYLRIRGANKSVLVLYRDAGGAQRWHRVCDASVSPKEIADAIGIIRGRIAKGGDPAEERKAEAKRERARLKPALEAYDTDLERRKVVKRGEVMSLLRRELEKPLGNVDLTALTRNDLVKRIRAVEASGRPGTAKELKTRAGVFLGWCVDHGLITASPLAGWRRQRKTKAERIERPGRALADWELPELWKAADAQGWPFGAYLKLLLLLGQRRAETALMEWSDVDLTAKVWTVPAEITKSGRAHRVPLPRQAVEILRTHKRAAKCDLVFPGRRNHPMTGWSKRLPAVYKLTEAADMEHWTLHDLRRTVRTGLGKLGVDRVIAELLLNHAISDELTAIYDRADYWQQRVEAAQRWADHIMGAIKAGADKVVALRGAS